MARTSTTYMCTACGEWEGSRWYGKCPDCGAFNSIQEKSVDIAPSGRKQVTVDAASFQLLSEVDDLTHERVTTGISELDRVLGGGFVPGSYVLVAGEPGAGKSTLTSELLIELAKSGKKVGVISGEESRQQAKLRYRRLLDGAEPPAIYIGTDTNVEQICKAIEAEGFDALVIDSIQTVFSLQVAASPGSTSQMRECSSQIRNAAKNNGTTVFLVGQVTKDGDAAGPRALEHEVDAFLVFEGDRREQVRILRTLKNRFGSTDEIGVFTMTGRGLEPVDDPSALFLPDRLSAVPGSAICPVLEGTRPLLCEVMALVQPSYLAQPIRNVVGLDPRRVQQLLAVLGRKLNYHLGAKDVFISVAGGLKVSETAADLAVCLAVVSALTGRPIKENYAVYGEVTLLGEVRRAAQAERRQNEAEKQGFTAYAPTGRLLDLIDDALEVEAVEDPLEDDEAKVPLTSR